MPTGKSHVNHVVMWGHVRNKKCYISSSARPITTKLDRLMTYGKVSPPTIVTLQNSHVTNKNCFMSISTWLMDTKHDRVMAYGIGPPRIKSHDSLITWSYEFSWQAKTVISPVSSFTTLFLSFTLHKTWQSGDLWHVDTTQKISSCLVKTLFHSYIYFFSIPEMYRWHNLGPL